MNREHVALLVTLPCCAMLCHTQPFLTLTNTIYLPTLPRGIKLRVYVNRLVVLILWRVYNGVHNLMRREHIDGGIITAFQYR